MRSGTARERALLAAGFDEAPSEQSVRAASIALGLLPNARALATDAPWFRRFAGVRRLRLALNIVAPIAIVGGSIAALEGAWNRSPTTSPVPVLSAVAAPSSATLPPVASVKLSVRSSTVTPSTEPLARPIAAVSIETAKRKVDTFAAQVALIDRARALAGAGNSAGTLRAVDEYDRRFPGGLLSEEALLLRTEAVLASGGRDAASGLAQRFLAEYPRSVHADRLRSLLERGSH
jgi:hypothetical protein